MNESDLDSDSNEIIYDTDSDIEIISDSYFKINSIGALNKKNIKLKSELIKLKHLNETINENLSVSKKTILEMDQIIFELTNKVNELEYKNKEITSKIIIADEKTLVLTQNIQKLDEQVEKLDEQVEKLDEQVEKLNSEKQEMNIICKSNNNWFLSKAVSFFFLISCPGIISNHNNKNKSK